MGLRQSFFMRLRHCPFIFKTVQAAFDHSPFVLSITLHLFAVFLLTYDFSSENKSNVVSVPMFVVDLSQVKIAEMTNLPPKLAKTEVKRKRKNPYAPRLTAKLLLKAPNRNHAAERNPVRPEKIRLPAQCWKTIWASCWIM